MTRKLMRLTALVGCFIILSGNLSAQSFSFNCTRDTLIAGCSSVPCFILKSIIPDLHGLSDTYTINPSSTVNGCPPVYVQPDDPGGTPTGLTIDDTYTGVINLAFPFPFFGTSYNSLIASTNGLISFDISKAGAFAHFAISNNLPSTTYDRAIIMGPYHDLNPAIGSSPTMRIQYQDFGVAPHRRWVFSFFKVPLYSGGGACNSLIENTHQIVLYESTGIIEVTIFSKQICASWQGGRAMVGMQDFNRTQSIMAPNRAALDPPWGSIGMNESWRFVPSSGPSLFKRVELYDILGTLISTGTVVNLGNGSMEASFPNICPPAGATTHYIVKSVYEKIDDPAVEIFGTDTIRVTKGAPTDLNATATSTSSTCGPPSGTITVTVPGGTAPFTYVMDGGAPQLVPASVYTFNNVAPGPHTVVVTDASGVCNSTIPVTVAMTSNLTGIVLPNATSCPGVNNGTISVTPVNGTGPYTFVLNPGNIIQTGATAFYTNLSPNAYTISITDATGCVTTPVLNAFVATGSGLFANALPTATSCAGASDGSISVTPISGTAPFTFVLDGTITQTGATTTFNGVASGLHTIVITDASGCMTNPGILVNVIAGSSLAATSSSTATTCAGASDGSVTITPTNGIAPYTFVLDGTITQTGVTTTFTGLTSGPHTITITDANGCMSNPGGILVNILAGAALTATSSSTATTCAGASNGTITITPSNGTGPYTFVLDGTITQTGATTTFNGLTSGPHTFTITDINGCMTNPGILVNVSAGSALTATSSSTATSCAGASNGSVLISPTNGTAPYSFVLDGTVTQTGTSTTFLNLAAGNHTVVVTDISGCVSNPISVNVVAGPPLVTTATKTDVLCNGGVNGTITITQPSMGTAPYQYSLDGIIWQPSNVFNGLSTGTYTVYYRESNGCQGSLSISVSEPAVLTTSASTIAAICNGQSNGIITVVSGGGISPHQYSIDGGTNWQSSNVFNVAAGNYTVLTRDANNCTSSRTVTVTEPTVLAASSVNNPASCNGGNDGVITVTANGGNPSFQYSLDGINFQAANTFNVAPGNYTVTVKDNLGCLTNFTTTVLLGSNFTLIPQADPTICEGTSTQLQLNSNAIQYAWTPATGLSSTTIPNPIANPTVTTQYIVTATLGRCTGNDTVIVNVNAAPIPNAGPDGFICYGQTYQLQASAGTQYSWSPATYLDNPSVSNPVSAAGKDIVYTLSILSDINGCASLVTDQVRIDVTPPIKVKTFPYDTIGYSGDQFRLLVVPSDSDVINYTWSPASGLNDPTIPNPVVTLGATGDIVQYQVITSTIAGCRGEGYVTVRVYKGPDIYMPTGFTPNGDGRNDKFIPVPVGMKSYKYFRVFNRWGQLIFSTAQLHDGWDGKLGGRDQPTGVYVWIIEGTTNDDRVITKKGTVTLIR